MERKRRQRSLTNTYEPCLDECTYTAKRGMPANRGFDTHGRKEGGKMDISPDRHAT